MIEAKVDVVFQLRGKTIPVDHGYALFSAISHIVLGFHDDENVLLSLIRGRYLGDGFLDIQPKSELTLRISSVNLGPYMNLAGKKFEIKGNQLQIGVPNTKALIPSPALYSHLVTTKNGNEQSRFEKEIQRQLDELGIKGKFQIGERRTFKIHDKQVVGYSLLVSELTAEESIAIQEHGLGGRHKMGCGFFVSSGTAK